MDLQIADLEDLSERLETALDRIAELQMGARIQSDAFFSKQFMIDHTEFESFEAFCEQSPWSIDDDSDLQELPRDRLDEFVAARTDFESWENMKTKAAEERIVEQIQA